MKPKEHCTQAQLLNRIRRFCDWAESHEGHWVLLCKDDRDWLGQMAQSKLGDLRHALDILFEGWPKVRFIIDLRHHCYALDAYCEVMGAAREIEDVRGLQEWSLQSRLCIIDGSDPKTAERQAFEDAEQAEIVRSLLVSGTQQTPLNGRWWKPITDAIEQAQF